MFFLGQINIDQFIFVWKIYPNIRILSHLIFLVQKTKRIYESVFITFKNNNKNKTKQNDWSFYRWEKKPSDFVSRFEFSFLFLQIKQTNLIKSYIIHQLVQCVNKKENLKEKKRTNSVFLSLSFFSGNFPISFSVKVIFSQKLSSSSSSGYFFPHTNKLFFAPDFFSTRWNEMTTTLCSEKGKWKMNRKREKKNYESNRNRKENDKLKKIDWK